MCPFGVPGFAPIMTSAVKQQNLKDERMATGSRDGEPQTKQDLGSSDAPTVCSPAALIEYEMPAQPVDATQALNLSAGVSNCKVSRGRSFS